jgi:PAS domain S-box-containing protein
MDNDLHEIFRLAAKHFYRRYKKNGGSQAQIAEMLSVTPSYISAVMSGSKTASLELQNRIANILYGPFEEFLMIGRRIKNNLDPQLMVTPESEENMKKFITQLGHYISDYHRIEKELVRLKNFYEEIVQNLQSGVIVTDRDDMIFFANESMSVIAGVSSVKLLAINIFSLEEEFPAAEVSEFYEKYREAKIKLMPLFYENVRVIVPNGRKAYLSGWLVPKIKDCHYNGMTCTIRDTTRSHDLSKLLMLSLDNSPYAICMAKEAEQELDIRPYFSNTKMKLLFGLETSKQPGICVDAYLNRCDEFIINKEEWRRFMQQDCDSAKKKSIIIQHINGGQYRWTTEQLLDKDGKLWGLMAVVKEVKQREMQD